MDDLKIHIKNEEPLIAIEQKSNTYPDYVISGLKESIKQAEENQLTPYKGIRHMLDL